MPGTWSGSTCAANEVEQQKHQNTSTDCTVLNLIVMCVCLHEPNEISFKTHKNDTIEIACDVKEHHHSIIISAFGTAYMTENTECEHAHTPTSNQCSHFANRLIFTLLSLLMPLKTLSTTLNEQREVYTMLWIVIYLIFTLIALFSSLSLFSFTFVTLWLIDILLRLQFTAKPEQVACILKL